jgi:Zn-dependent M16 (insulinase) family peptidase
LSLDIYRSPDAIVALGAVRNLLNSIASGKVNISQTSLEAAKSQVAFDTVQDECTPTKAVGASSALAASAVRY